MQAREGETLTKTRPYSNPTKDKATSINIGRGLCSSKEDQGSPEARNLYIETPAPWCGGPKSCDLPTRNSYFQRDMGKKRDNLRFL
jgi:hypothetical protein